MMPAADRTPPPARPRAAWLARAAGLGLPLGASLAVHAVIAGTLAWVALAWHARPALPPPGAEVFVQDAPMDLTPAEPTRPPAPTRAETPRTSAVAVRLAGESASSPTAPTPAPAQAAASPAPATPSASAAPSLASTLAAPGPAVSFAGLASPPGERVASVVYVVDASGPMVSSLPDVLAEVRRSVDALAPTQRFSVVVFQGLDGSDAAQAFAPAPVDASARNRAALAQWLARIEPKGRSTPLDGLALALAMTPRPQLVFLLTRSISRSGGGAWDLGAERTMARLDTLNPIDHAAKRRPSTIRTIQFIDPDPTGIMRSIAAYHGSGDIRRDHRVLSQRELDGR